MNLGPRRWLLVVVFTLVAAVGCAPAATPPSPSLTPTTPPSATTSSTPAGTSAPEHAALEAEIDNAISTGPATLDNVRAVLVNVDGETKIAHYRHGFTGNDHLHVFSVTKSVLSTLMGIAIADGLIDDIDQPLIELLPKHRQAMSGDAAKVTLRHLMTMSGGFNQFPGGFVWVDAAKPGNSFIDVLLERRQQFEPGEVFWYSDASAHLAAAVLAAALERADGDRPRTILDYAREKLFDPLGISTQPSFSGPVPDPLLTPDFVAADFGWGTDPNGIQLGGFGLRLTAPDMMKIGELYRRGGVWNGQRIVPSAWIRQCTSPARFERKVNSPTDLDYGLLWWIIAKPRGAGYLALGFGGQHILVLPKSRAVIVYMSDVQSNSYIEDVRDLEPLDKVLHDAFLR